MWKNQGKCRAEGRASAKVLGLIMFHNTNPTNSTTTNNTDGNNNNDNDDDSNDDNNNNSEK